MSNIMRLGLRYSMEKFLKSSKYLVKPALNSSALQANYSRALWHMCSTSRINDGFLKEKPLNECCRCGCSGLMHTNGEKDLAEFLNEEIAGEKKVQKLKSLPSELDGFKISTDMAELVFQKKTESETLTVSMNINHSIDAEDVGEDGELVEEMKSKPSFEVDITRNKKTLSFSCSFTHFKDQNDSEAVDAFEIDEITYYEGDWDDKTYCIAADLLDENLYDLFMVVLNEKGITKEFMEKVSEIATSHEHLQYIGLLENVRKFALAN